MGMFDFLFWNREIKTDTEKYMESRNRDYARKVREYKNRELELVKNSKVDVYKPKNLPTSNASTRPYTERTYNAERPCYASPTSGHKSQTSGQKSQEQLKQELLAKYGHPQAHKPSNPMKTNDCDTNLQSSSDKKAAFSVLAVVFDPQKGLAKVTGRVERGRFERGDVVNFGDTGMSLPIIGMIRQGEPVDYVNSASGTVVVNFKTRKDLPIRKGESLHKNTL